MAVTVINCAKELLVPANGAKELRRKFVFRFDVIRECICVSHIRHFKSRFIKLGPNLKMTPGEADILPQNELTIIVDVAPGRNRGFGFVSKICAIARRNPKIPRLIRPKTDSPAESRIV